MSIIYTPRMHFKLTLKISFLIFSLHYVGDVCAMNLFNTKSPLSAIWRERFSDVSKLNDYTKDHSIEISDTKIKNQNINGAVLHGGKIDNTDMNNVTFKNSKIDDVTFSNGIIEDVDFSNSVLTNVVFENVKLRGVAFFDAKLNNVRFIHSTFNGVGMDETIDSHIEIIDSKAISSSFSRGQLEAVFKNCKLSEGVKLTSLHSPSSLTFEKTELSKVDLERSKLKNLIIDQSVFDSIFDVGSAENILVKNSVLDASFSAANIGKLSIANTKIKNLSVLRAKVGSVILSNCDEMSNFGMFQSTVGRIKFEHCSINDFRPIEAKIGELVVNDSSINNSTFQEMNAQKVNFNAVVLSGEVNFKNAKIIDFKSSNIIKKSGLKLITDGCDINL